MTSPIHTIEFKLLQYKAGESDMDAHELAEWLYGQMQMHFTGWATVMPDTTPHE